MIKQQEKNNLKKIKNIKLLLDDHANHKINSHAFH